MEKEDGKKVAKSMLWGLILAILLCGVVYLVLILHFHTYDVIAPVNGKRENEKEYIEEMPQKEKTEKKDTDVKENVVSPEKTIAWDANGKTVAAVNPNGQSSTQFLIMNEGIRYFNLVYPKTSRAGAEAAKNLNSVIERTTGYHLIAQSDSDSQGTYEVLIGDTNRMESTILKNTMVSSGSSYAVSTVGNKIVIVGGSDYSLKKGVNYLMNAIASGSAGETSIGRMTILRTLSYMEPNKKGLHEKLISADSLQAVTQNMFTIPQPSNTRIAEGGCSDGTYYYQLFIWKDDENEENNITVLIKSDMQTGAVVKTSEDLALNHANDMTYNSRLGCLVVCHNAPNMNRLSYLNPDTLQVMQTFEIGYQIFSIDYNFTSNRYVVGLSGGQNFQILDADFHAVGGICQPARQTSGYTTQGVGSDEEFIYFVLYKQNVITVYDWNGAFVSLIRLDIPETIEPENIAIVNDEIYIGCNVNDGAAIYKVTVLK